MNSPRVPRNPVRRLQARLAGMAAVIGQTRDGVYGLSASHEAQRADIARLGEQLAAIERRARDERAEAVARDEHQRRILRVLFSEERAMRERLWHERSTEEYELAYSDPEPLVSVVIPTYDNFRLLGERSLPSILGQTYQNFEVIVVGDGAPPEAAQTVARFGDARLHFHNLNRRGPYPSEPTAFWHWRASPPTTRPCADRGVAGSPRSATTTPFVPITSRRCSSWRGASGSRP